MCLSFGGGGGGGSVDCHARSAADGLDEFLFRKLPEDFAGDGTVDLVAFDQVVDCDDLLFGDFLDEFVIEDLVEDDTVVSLLPELSLGPSL